MLVDSTLLVGWPTDRSSCYLKKSVVKLMDRTVYAACLSHHNAYN